jgi:hypothetical protein
MTRTRLDIIGAHSRKRQKKKEETKTLLKQPERERDSTTSVEDTSTLKNFSKTVPPER